MHLPGPVRRALLIGLAGSVQAWTLAAQNTLGPDEFRVSARPYVPPSLPSIKTQVDLVEVPVVVRDGHGSAVSGLRQGDFELLDAGKKVDITSFSVETFADSPATPGGGAGPAGIPPRPGAAKPPVETPLRSIVLCFDDFSTNAADLKRSKDAAEKFVRNSLAPRDRVAVVSAAIDAPATFTSDVAVLVDSIRKLQPHPRFSEDNFTDCPRISSYEAYLISNNLDRQLLTDKANELRNCTRMDMATAVTSVQSKARQVWEAARHNSTNVLRGIQKAVEVAAAMPGRRMVLLVSAGFLSGDLLEEQSGLMRRALHAGVVINALQAKGLYVVIPGGGADEPPPVGRRAGRVELSQIGIENRQATANDDPLAVLSSGTGGAFFHNSNDLNLGFRQLGALPEIVYVLGFTPAAAASPERFHTLKVRLLSGGHYSVQARVGYTPAPRSAPGPPVQPEKRDVELLAADTLAEFPVTETAEMRIGERGARELSVGLRIDVKQLHFDLRNERRCQKLTFIVALLDAHGNFVTGREASIELSLKDASYARFAATGLTARAMLEAPPGTYTLRDVVEDSSGKMAAASSLVEVR